MKKHLQFNLPTLSVNNPQNLVDKIKSGDADNNRKNIEYKTNLIFSHLISTEQIFKLRNENHFRLIVLMAFTIKIP